MWLVTHVSDSAGREIAVSILIFSFSFQQALLNVYKAAVSCLFVCLFKALEMSSCIGFSQDWGGSDSLAEGPTRSQCSLRWDSKCDELGQAGTWEIQKREV